MLNNITKSNEIRDSTVLENHTPMMAQYLSIKHSYPDSILFYRMGDFYEMFFDDAIKASAVLDIALTKRGHHAGEEIPLCGVPVIQHEAYLAKLIRSGFKVAVCEQTEDAAEAKKRGYKSVVRREVVRLITAGTITEENLLDARQANYLVALAEVQGKLGIAWLDISTGDFYLQPTDIGKVALVLDRLQPGELLLPDRLANQSAFAGIIQEWNKVLNPLPAARFDSENGKKRLQTLFNVGALDGFGNFSRSELAAGGVLIDYVELTQKGKLPRLSPPKSVPEGAVMEIDAATRRNLELAETLSGEKYGSLLSVIDRTITGSGARLLAAHLAAPLTNCQEIRQRLDMVEFFCERPGLRQDIQTIFRHCPDMERSLARLSLGRGGPRDLANIRDGLTQLPILSKLLPMDQPNQSSILPQPELIQKAIADLGYAESAALQKKLVQALGTELPIITRDGGFIAPGFHAGLDELRSLRDESRRLIATMQANYSEMSGVTNLKIKHNNVLGYYIEIPPKHAEKMGEPFIHRQTIASSVRFTTVELGNLEQKIVSAADRAVALEMELFNELQNDILVKAEQIATASRVLAVLDVATGLAELAAEKKYCRPKIVEDQSFDIIAGRHPIVENSSREPFIANHCNLENKQRLWLITGPNMAGKSTFLRQNALIAIMAQMGSFVPAEKATIGIIDRLFSRVGAADDLARGRSTFMVEMVETAAILNQAGPKSLVILDEIGRGTATFDGLSIAWAVVENLHEVNRCRALFATHYHELTRLAASLRSLSCHSMRVKEWQGDVIFLHEISPGTADRSYGIHVAKLAGLPEAVLQRSSDILKLLEKGDQSSTLTKLVDDLPLFAAAKAQAPVRQPTIPKAMKTIASLEPDHITPREALDILYQLKDEMREENQKSH